MRVVRIRKSPAWAIEALHRRFLSRERAGLTFHAYVWTVSSWQVCIKTGGIDGVRPKCYKLTRRAQSSHIERYCFANKSQRIGPCSWSQQKHCRGWCIKKLHVYNDDWSQPRSGNVTEIWKYLNYRRCWYLGVGVLGRQWNGSVAGNHLRESILRILNWDKQTTVQKLTFRPRSNSSVTMSETIWVYVRSSRAFCKMSRKEAAGPAWTEICVE